MKEEQQAMAPIVRIGWTSQGDDPAAQLEREWLVTNGLGGYASGTIAGMATRRYHGLLVAALPNPRGRTMMFDQLTETVRLPDGREVELAHGVPEGEQHEPPNAHLLREFRLEYGLPVWLYRLDDAVLEKRLLLAYLQNTVYLRYRIFPASGTQVADLVLTLRPAMHFRPHDAPVSRPLETYVFSLTGDRFEVSTSGPLPSLKMRVEGDRPSFKSFPAKQDATGYRWEAARGYEAQGTLWSPGYFEVKLTTPAPAFLVASSEGSDTMNAVPPSRAWDYEGERRARLLHAAPAAREDETAAELVLAADAFVIVPAGRVEDATRARARGLDLRSIVAGYHWFTDWGRDTMISLEGLTLITGRFQEARDILHTFGHYVREGLLPNLFPEGSQEGRYNTAVASLWFFHALDRYLALTGDRQTLQLLIPTLEAIAAAHAFGTSFGIGIDPADGLLTQGQESCALTWMDALCDGWVVTPRRGKAVEINALWFNAMTLLSDWVESEGDADRAKPYRELAARARVSFNRLFWNERVGYLVDVIAPDGSADSSLRPNQLFAISLPHPVLDPTRWRAVVDKVAASLLTPYGLRSLDPGHADFKPNYHGDLRTRDAAYHQGTVWSWLLGPFIDAWLKVYPERRAQARKMLEGLREHLGAACLGQVSEIFDATPPFLPRGCIAQAWGVAELLRAWHLTATPTTKGDEHASP
jgi:predicted glycogen debranching enzyme